MKYVYWTLGAILIIFIALQFPYVNRNIEGMELTNTIKSPDEVKQYLVQACYNCHSDQIEWPIQSYIAPISWYMVSKAKTGRSILNFSRWETYDKEKKAYMFQTSSDMILGKQMPVSIRGDKHPEFDTSSLNSRAAADWLASQIKVQKLAKKNK